MENETMNKPLPEYQDEYPSRFPKGSLGYVLDQESGDEEITKQRTERDMKTILFLDGVTAIKEVHVVGGACLVGQPTAYVVRCGTVVWVKPGTSVDFVEVV